MAISLLLRLPPLLVHVAFLVVVAHVLVSAGQPIFTDDSWWHLAMGQIYAASGPWLESDPFLFAASGPPAPAAWLSGVLFHAVHQLGGFSGLRILHVILVGPAIALAWSMLRRVSGSNVFASLGALIFTLLSAYRFFQLRPHLVTILSGLVLVRLLIVDGAPPSRLRVAAGVLVLAIWANSHGAFLLGPVLLAAAILGLLAAGLFWQEWAPSARSRVCRLALALALGLLATLVNPQGLGLHLLYFQAGAETPDLTVVGDEWAPVSLFALPLANLPPTPLNWAIIWGLLIATPAIVLLSLRVARARPPARAAPPLDPALVAIAAVSLVGMLTAVRLLWLGLFPLLVIGDALRVHAAARREPGRSPLVWTAVAALAAMLLVPGFRALGDWPMISQGLHLSWYARPYSATKYRAHAVWFLRDAGLEGRLFNDYSSGNFLSYWLAPRLQVFINGSLNVPLDSLASARAIMARTGLAPGETLAELLDRHRIDLFVGTGTPWVSLPGRPMISTTTHLERMPGWILVFREMQSAIYLRDVERNRSNLQRVVDYYAVAGVPFDPELGFDPFRVMQGSLGWAVDHGLVPETIEQLEAESRSRAPAIRRQAQDRLASIYAVMGVYERSAEIDARHLRVEGRSLWAARRLVWSLLHQRRIPESLEAAEQLARIASPQDGLSRRLIDAARRAGSAKEDEIATMLATLPVFERPQGHQVFVGYREPEARLTRD